MLGCAREISCGHKWYPLGGLQCTHARAIYIYMTARDTHGQAVSCWQDFSCTKVTLSPRNNDQRKAVKGSAMAELWRFPPYPLCLTCWHFHVLKMLLIRWNFSLHSSIMSAISPGASFGDVWCWLRCLLQIPPSNGLTTVPLWSNWTWNRPTTLTAPSDGRTPTNTRTVTKDFSNGCSSS